MDEEKVPIPTSGQARVNAKRNRQENFWREWEEKQRENS